VITRLATPPPEPGRGAGPEGEPRIVGRAPASDRFRDIVLPHLGDALALARWLTGNPHDAEDVVQEACLRALAAIDGYRGGDGGGSARPWLLAIVRNTCLTWLAKHRHKGLVLVGGMSELDDIARGGDPAFPAVPAATPETELIRKADAAAVEAAIAAVPPPFREVLVLRDVNGLSYREIAAMLTMPIGTVMSRLARGRAMLAAGIVEAR
jgi:RNA polymerase sigma factor (sigma-70 family)